MQCKLRLCNLLCVVSHSYFNHDIGKITLFSSLFDTFWIKKKLNSNLTHSYFESLVPSLACPSSFSSTLSTCTNGFLLSLSLPLTEETCFVFTVALCGESASLGMIRFNEKHQFRGKAYFSSKVTFSISLTAADTSVACGT